MLNDNAALLGTGGETAVSGSPSWTGTPGYQIDNNANTQRGFSKTNGTVTAYIYVNLDKARYINEIQVVMEAGINGGGGSGIGTWTIDVYDGGSWSNIYTDSGVQTKTTITISTGWSDITRIRLYGTVTGGVPSFTGWIYAYEIRAYTHILADSGIRVCRSGTADIMKVGMLSSTGSVALRLYTGAAIRGIPLFQSASSPWATGLRLYDGSTVKTFGEATE